MDIPPPPPSNESWQDLVNRAAAEAPPEIDVRFSVRQQIESELVKEKVRSAAPSILDEIAALVQYRWGLSAAAAALLLAFQFLPAIRDVAIALQFQSQLLAGQ